MRAHTRSHPLSPPFQDTRLPLRGTEPLGTGACVLHSQVFQCPRLSMSSRIRALNDQLRRSLSGGVLVTWRRFAARELGVILTVSPLKVSEPSLRGIWRGLRRVLDGKS